MISSLAACQPGDEQLVGGPVCGLYLAPRDTLLKGAKPQPVSTVSLQLKKTDQKKGKYTLNVTSDDRTIEKKDRTVSEPPENRGDG